MSKARHGLKINKSNFPSIYFPLDYFVKKKTIINSVTNLLFIPSYLKKNLWIFLHRNMLLCLLMIFYLFNLGSFTHCGILKLKSPLLLLKEPYRMPQIKPRLALYKASTLTIVTITLTPNLFFFPLVFLSFLLVFSHLIFNRNDYTCFILK